MNMIEASISSTKGFSLSTVMANAAKHWIALGRVKGLGGAGVKKLAAYFTDPTKAFAASQTELAGIEGLDKEAVDGLLSFSDWDRVEEEMRRARNLGITLIPFTDAAYPSRLRMIADPPFLLYVKGEIRTDDERAVAVVGSRSASDYGRRVARDLCQGLVSLGFAVVSGMARGIDGVAHEATLSSGGRTFAVLGCGVDRVYPPEHAVLYRRIFKQGAIISELPLGTRPMAYHFPARNRLISGLSLGVVVVEATEKSGSLITASLAVEQGREVFAVPGEVGASRSRGAHQLIRQGAKLVERVDDIVEEIAPQLLANRHGSAREPKRTLGPGASEDARKIFALLQRESLQIDQVIEGSGCSPSRVSEILLELELQGFLRQLPGKRYTADY